MADFILASASPRRRELLERLGFTVSIQPAHIDETPMENEMAIAYVCRMAKEKACAVPCENWVLAADTIVQVDDAILGKAQDEDEARQMLQRMSGRVHQVTTAFALRGPGALKVDSVTTHVHMRPMSDEEISNYLLSGEWRGKAGAYAIQGIAAVFVHRVEGSVSNVIGLPLSEVVEVLRDVASLQPKYKDGVPC